MTTIAIVTPPEFSESERETLRGIEGVLAQHPYLRAWLGGSGPLAQELEEVLSTRLALGHTEGGAHLGGAAAALLAKLQRWEADLARAATSEAGSEEALLRYETNLWLHPFPSVGEPPSSNAASLTRLTRDWERLRARRALRSLVLEKAKQSRDFIRHGTMLPLYWLRRRRVRRLVPNAVLTTASLRETLFAIEQIGPLVDSFAFDTAGGIPLSKSVALADIAFLYMQLGDELLDELAAAAGGHDRAGTLVRGVYRHDGSVRPLADLSLGHLRAGGIDPDAHVTRFGITLSVLFGALQELAASMDRLIMNAGEDTARATGLFLHHCFQTYLDEAELCKRAPEGRADRMHLRDTGWHFYRKNNMVMMLWLDLRARLLGLDPARHAAAIRRWGYLLSAFQIFDDLKDMALDLGKQPSYPLQIAAHEFPEELAWLEQRFGARRFPLTRDDVPEVNRRAGRTVRQCMRWSRLIALAHFDNTLLYAWDQRWRKSWNRRRSSFNPPGSAVPAKRLHAVDRLVRGLLAMPSARSERPVEDEQLAFALDATAYEGAWEIYVALFPNVRAIYRFATLRMWMSAEEKARVARRLLRRYPRARAHALVGVSDADVDHEVARDRLEAFAKLMEVQ